MHPFTQFGQGAMTNNAIVDNQSGYCSLCQKLSCCVCQRCGDFYCSPECQRKDWQRHRYICMPLPALIHASAFFESSLLIKTQAQPNFAVNGIQMQMHPSYQYAAVPSHPPAHYMGVNANILSPTTTTNNLNLNRASANNNESSKAEPPNDPKQSKVGVPLISQKPQLQANQQQHQQKANQQQQSKPIQQQQQSKPIQQQSKPIQQQSKPNQQQSNQSENQPATKQTPSTTAKPALQQNQVHLRPPQANLPASNSRVVITGFRSINRCYIREVNTNINDAYCAIIDKINAYGKGAAKLQSQPNTNSFAITKRDGAMHRVQILPGKGPPTAQNRYRVLFVDTGHISLRNLEDLHEISDEIIKLPQYIVMVQLQSVKNYAISEELNAWLAQFEGVEYKILYNDKGYKHVDYLVRLLNWETNNNLGDEIRMHCTNKNIYETSSDMRSRYGSNASINTVANEVIKNETMPTVASVKNGQDAKESSLLGNGESTPHREEIVAAAEKLIAESVKTSPPKSTLIARVESAMKNAMPITGAELPPMLNPPFNHRKLPLAQKDLNVFVVDKSNIAHGYIGCFDVCERATLSAVQDYLSNFKDEQPYTPVLHEYVIAKYEDEWFRAKVLSVIAGSLPKFTVLFIDFTNESTLTIENIRRYPDNLKSDCFTNFCFIDGFPKTLKEEQIQFLKTKLNGNSTLTVDSVSYHNEDLAIIKCSAFIKELNDKVYTY